MIPLPPCVLCHREGRVCRTEITLPEQILRVRLCAVVWPCPKSRLQFDVITWYDPHDAEVVFKGPRMARMGVPKVPPATQ
jgi:hypothetical protein